MACCRSKTYIFVLCAHCDSYRGLLTIMPWTMVSIEKTKINNGFRDGFDGGKKKLVDKTKNV